MQIAETKCSLAARKTRARETFSPNRFHRILPVNIGAVHFTLLLCSRKDASAREGSEPSSSLLIQHLLEVLFVNVRDVMLCDSKPLHTRKPSQISAKTIQSVGLQNRPTFCVEAWFRSSSESNHPSNSKMCSDTCSHANVLKVDIQLLAFFLRGHCLPGFKMFRFLREHCISFFFSITEDLIRMPMCRCCCQIPCAHL